MTVISQHWKLMPPFNKRETIRAWVTFALPQPTSDQTPGIYKGERKIGGERGRAEGKRNKANLNKWPRGVDFTEDLVET